MASTGVAGFSATPVRAPLALMAPRARCRWGSAPMGRITTTIRGPYPRSVPVVELQPTSVAAGGEAVARDSDGRVVFVTGALPGKRVAVEITATKARFARGRTVEVIDPSVHR